MLSATDLAALFSNMASQGVACPPLPEGLLASVFDSPRCSDSLALPEPAEGTIPPAVIPTLDMEPPHALPEPWLHIAQMPAAPCGACPAKAEPKSAASSPGSVRSSNGKRSCDVCRAAFSRKDRLKSHRDLHFKASPFQCLECKRAFTQRHHLKKHMLLHGVSDSNSASSDDARNDTAWADSPDAHEH